MRRGAALEPENPAQDSLPGSSAAHTPQPLAVGWLVRWPQQGGWQGQEVYD